MLLNHLFTEEQNGIREMIRKFVDKEIMLNVFVVSENGNRDWENLVESW